MTDNFDERKDQYNKFLGLADISYNCIKYLMDNEEDLWKLLYYNDADCWNKDNLTMAQKASLIYAGQPNETDFRVFSDVGADNTWLVEACLLRVSPTTISPNNHIYGNVGIAFEMYSHYKINHLSNYKTRIDYGSQRIFEAMNGVEIEGVGRIFFDKKSKSVVLGGVPFKGRATVFYGYSNG